MSQWAHDNPEAMSEIADLPLSQQNEALRSAMGGGGRPTSPSIIGDVEAKRIAQEDVRTGRAAASSEIGKFARSGRISQHLAHWSDGYLARRDCTGDLERLRAYVAHHGERGPQSDWSEL